MTDIKPGDHVLHKPSGETWVVAYADPARNEIAWCGWPEGAAKISDCELVRVATSRESDLVISQWTKGVRTDSGQLDSRSLAVRRLYN